MKHKQPLNYDPSAFVLSCITSKNIEVFGKALDLACGFGRHTHFLNSHGYSVVSGDISLDGLNVIKQESPLEACCVILDASMNLPFKDNTFGLVLAVHYVDKGLLSRIARLIALGGYLIYETYGGQGDNWRTLPLKGELENELGSHFSIIKLKETYVGSGLDQHVNTKLFARRINE